MVLEPDLFCPTRHLIRGQEADAVALQTAVPDGAAQARNSLLQGVAVVIERQKELPTEPVNGRLLRGRDGREYG